jgi:hypothetical protein
MPTDERPCIVDWGEPVLDRDGLILGYVARVAEGVIAAARDGAVIGVFRRGDRAARAVRAVCSRAMGARA